MAQLHFAAAWIGILAGMVAGAALGLRFHGEAWLGGYASWPRRLLRLGHISLFGLAFVNLAFALTARGQGWSPGTVPGTGAASALFLAGAVLMPAVCALAAWRRPLRHLFFLPVGSLAAAAAMTALAVLRTGGAP